MEFLRPNLSSSKPDSKPPKGDASKFKEAVQNKPSSVTIAQQQLP